MRIAIVGDFNPSFPPHPATGEALSHAAAALGLSVEAEWLPTGSIGPPAEKKLAEYAGLWIAPGSPYQNLAGALRAIRFARENDVPLLGTCGGLQHMILELARNVLGIADAAHAEYDPYASRLLVTRLDCSLSGKQMPIELCPGSRAAAAYGTLAVVEQYYCNFGLNRDYQDQLAEAGFRVVGSEPGGEPRILEISPLRFFVGTLFVPQVRSTPGQPHPLALALLRAAAGMPGTAGNG
jgi:CTP synthase (UTP-ammonia lyase)